MFSSILFIFILLLYSEDIHAGPFSIDEKSYNLKVGLGIRLRTNIRKDNSLSYKDNNPIFIPFPFARLKFSKLEIEPDKIKFVFVRNAFLEIDTRVNYKGHDYNHATMGHRHKTAFAGFTLRLFMFRLKFLHDIQDKSGGSIARLSGLLPLYFSDETKLLLQAGFEYWDHKYVDYYFGVRINEVTSTRSYYKGQKQQSIFGKAIYIKQLSEHFLTRITFSFRRWDGHLIDSPTVATTKIFDSVAGVVYEF